VSRRLRLPSSRRSFLGFLSCKTESQKRAKTSGERHVTQAMEIKIGADATVPLSQRLKAGTVGKCPAVPTPKSRDGGKSRDSWTS
jgi:hypothetical protein